MAGTRKFAESREDQTIPGMMVVRMLLKSQQMNHVNSIILHSQSKSNRITG